MKLARDYAKYGVTLKPLSADMLEMVREWRNDPEISQHMLTQDYISADQQRDWYAKIARQTSVIYWVVWFKGEPIGVASLTAIDQERGIAEPGMYIYPEQYRNNIVPFCVAFALNDFAFQELNLKLLIGKIFEDNAASLRFHEKTGYRPVANEVQREFGLAEVTMHKGQKLYWFTLSRDDYETAKAPIARFIRY